MTKKTKLEILSAIEHWHNNLDNAILLDLEKEEIWRSYSPYLMGSIISLDKEDCALCRSYFNNALCTYCPIKRKTGKIVCRETPYISVYLALESRKSNTKIIQEIKNELTFLYSLLD